MTEYEVVVLGKKTDRPRGLRLLDGKKDRDTTGLLMAALDRMGDDWLSEEFLVLQPENGWGDLTGAIQVMRCLYEGALEYPDNVWDIG